MRSIKRILAVSGLTGMFAALAFTGTASAVDIDRLKGACITTGTAKVTPIPFVGGTGTYLFQDLVFTCVGIEQAKGAVLQSVGLINLDISSPGDYTNIVCGTGKAVSRPATVNSATVTPIQGVPKTDTLPEWQAIAGDLGYVVEFVALNGLLKWTEPEAQKLGLEIPKVLTGGPAGDPGGYVLILPDETKTTPLPGACTKAFQVVAAVVVDWSPNNPI